MANPTKNDVHVDKALSNIAIHYKYPPIIADKIFPVAPVAKESDVYYTFSREALMEYPTLKAGNAPANEIDWEPDTETYSCKEYALSSYLSDRMIANADIAVRPRINTVKKLTRAIQIDWERRIQAIVQNPAVITNTGACSAAWNAAGANPQLDVDTAKNSVRQTAGTEPNTIVMSYEVSQDLLRWLMVNAYTDFQNYLRVGALPDEIWDLKVLVGKAVYNSANPGQAENITDIWQDDVLVCYVEPEPSLECFSLGYTFRARAFRTRYWTDGPRGGTVYETGVIQDEKLVSANAGYLITACHP